MRDATSEVNQTDPRYPIGKFKAPDLISVPDRVRYIEIIASAPARLRGAVQGFSPKQLDTPYRDGGWTIRQVIHHVPESHMNAYIRFKLAMYAWHCDHHLAHVGAAAARF